ncbi:MAG TPA: hypothetical protein DD381_06795, partial [Lentisphaeria bacterium]|nr:hypothetical protein [Lentisphaeria bacterium]
MNILCKHNLLVTVFFYIIFIFFIQLNANESSDTDTSVIVNKTNVLAIKNLPNKEDLITKNIAKDKEISTILSDKDIADKINQINNRIEIDENILANVLSAISAQFATASYVLGIVGLIFVILSIFLGIYINYISK